MSNLTTLFASYKEFFTDKQQVLLAAIIDNIRPSIGLRSERLPFSNEERDDYMARMLKSGFNKQEIARVFRVSAERVAQVVGRGPRVLPRFPIEDVVTLLEQGVSLTDVGRAIGCYPNRVVSKLAENGIDYGQFAEARAAYKIAKVESQLRKFLSDRPGIELSSTNLQRFDHPLDQRARLVMGIKAWRERLGLPLQEAHAKNGLKNLNAKIRKERFDSLNLPDEFTLDVAMTATNNPNRGTAYAQMYAMVYDGVLRKEKRGKNVVFFKVKS